MEPSDEFAAGDTFKAFEQMQNLYDKLQLLNYEADFLRITKLPPLHRIYFMIAINPGEQYYNFVTLSAWLIQKCGNQFTMPQEADDPNTIISKILETVQQMGNPVDFSISKVKSGFGQEVVNLLDFLTDQAISSTGHTWKQAVFPVEREELEEEEDDQVINLDKIEEDEEGEFSSDGEEGETPWAGAGKDSSKDQSKVLESNTNAEEWRMELERVLPQLKITMKTDSHDWRWRQEQMKIYANGINEALDIMEMPLEKVISEAKTVTERVQNRESFLSSQVENQLVKLSDVHNRIVEAREKHRSQSVDLVNKSRILAKLTEEVEEARRNLEDRGSVMADGAPVNQVRKALLAVRKEIGDMEVEIGVMEHCVLNALIQEQVTLRDSSL